MKKVYFKTFGCRTNIYDSQVMMTAMKDFEITENEEEAEAGFTYMISGGCLWAFRTGSRSSAASQNIYICIFIFFLVSA